jgi:hypothetical protein
MDTLLVLLAVNIVECGSTMGGYGNTCFFNSLVKGLNDIMHDLRECSFEEFLGFGGWPLSHRGKMVNTDLHDHNLEALAIALGIRIILAYEETTGLIAPEKIRIFGSEGPYVGIVKIHGAAHFRSFTTDFRALVEFNTDSQRRASRAIAQVQADARLAHSMFEREREREQALLRQEEADRRMAQALSSA